jgi:hypothetical protein
MTDPVKLMTETAAAGLTQFIRFDKVMPDTVNADLLSSGATLRSGIDHEKAAAMISVAAGLAEPDLRFNRDLMSLTPRQTRWLKAAAKNFEELRDLLYEAETSRAGNMAGPGMACIRLITNLSRTPAKTTPEALSFMFECLASAARAALRADNQLTFILTLCPELSPLFCGPDGEINQTRIDSFKADMEAMSKLGGKTRPQDRLRIMCEVLAPAIGEVINESVTGSITHETKAAGGPGLKFLALQLDRFGVKNQPIEKVREAARKVRRGTTRQ